MVRHNVDRHDELGLTRRNGYRAGQRAGKVARGLRSAGDDGVGDLYVLLCRMVERQNKVDDAIRATRAFDHGRRIAGNHDAVAVVVTRHSGAHVDGQMGLRRLAIGILDRVNEGIHRAQRRCRIAGENVAAIGMNK